MVQSSLSELDVKRGAAKAANVAINNRARLRKVTDHFELVLHGLQKLVARPETTLSRIASVRIAICKPDPDPPGPDSEIKAFLESSAI